MKHQHDWTELFAPAANLEEAMRLRSSGQGGYLECSCGLMASVSGGQQRGGGNRIIPLRSLTEERKAEIRSQAAEWNRR